MSSLQPSVQPGLPADLGARACLSDEANFPTEGRHCCARFIPGVRAQRQQREAKEDFDCIGASPPKNGYGIRRHLPQWGACGGPEPFFLSAVFSATDVGGSEGKHELSFYRRQPYSVVRNA